MRLFRSTAVVGLFTMASRVLGFIREIFFAAFIGPGSVLDAFLTAFQFPNLFRRIFAEGAFNSAFVPLYTDKLEDDGLDEARRFAREVASMLFTAMLVLVVAAQLAMPWLMYLLGPGFVDEPRIFNMAVLFTQITMPYLLLMSLCAMFSGVLNAHGKFAVAAAAPVILNLTLIAMMLLANWRGEQLAFYLTLGITGSGVLQTAWIYVAMRRLGIGLAFQLPRLTPDVKRLIWLGVPGAIAAGVTQINLLVTSAIATNQESARSWLYFADRLYQLPLGVVGIAMGVVLLPTLTARLGAGDGQGASNAMNRGIEISMALTLPAAAALIAMPEFLVGGLFERQNFEASDTVAVSRALIPFALGLPAFVLIKVLAPGFFARKDTITPMRFATVSVAVNLALGLALFYSPLRYVGLAVATAVASWVNTVLLAFVLHRRDILRPDARLLSRLPRILAASAVMGGALWLAQRNAEWITAQALGSPLLAVVLVSGGGAAVYGLAAFLTGALRLSDLSSIFRRA
jgi:putative peptidoglycan lipid II flippase